MDIFAWRWSHPLSHWKYSIRSGALNAMVVIFPELPLDLRRKNVFRRILGLS